MSSYLTNYKRKKNAKAPSAQPNTKVAKPVIGPPLAVLIGINYRNQSAELQGCVNDTLDMRNYLLSMGYLDSNIQLVNEFNNNRDFIPTRSNIIRIITSVLARAKTTNAREVFLHYSGHGSYIRDTNGDEADRRDEVIVPLDYLKVGFLSDDTINSLFVAANLPSTTKIYGVFDSCFSGSILDLRYRFVSGKPPAIENKYTGFKNEIYCISGCTDTQTSAETLLNGKVSGVLTTYFLSLVKNKNAVSLSSLITQLNALVKKDRYSQIPQLSSSKEIDGSSTFLSRVV